MDQWASAPEVVLVPGRAVAVPGEFAFLRAFTLIVDNDVAATFLRV
jgi:hypothetical protein